MSDRNSSSGNMGCVTVVGVILAALMSYNLFHAIGWALLAGFFGWLYVIYYLAFYGWPSL
jgi:hypothetical protein